MKLTTLATDFAFKLIWSRIVPDSLYTLLPRFAKTITEFCFFATRQLESGRGDRSIPSRSNPKRKKYLNVLTRTSSFGFLKWDINVNICMACGSMAISKRRSEKAKRSGRVGDFGFSVKSWLAFLTLKLTSIYRHSRWCKMLWRLESCANTFQVSIEWKGQFGVLFDKAKYPTKKKTLSALHVNDKLTSCR